VLHGETLQPPPFWLMRQAGRYLPEYRQIRERVTDFLELCYSPDIAAELTCQPLARYGMDAAILFADILLVADGLGQALRYAPGEGPLLEPIRRREDLAILRLERLGERVAPVYETVGRLSRELAPEVTLIGFAGAPWTLATYMVEGGTSRDFAKVKGWAFGDSEGFQELIDLLVAATTEYLDGQARAGAEVVQLFDTWAGVLPEAPFERWCVEPVAEIVRRFHELHPGVPVISFPRGAGARYAGYAARTGVACVGLDATVSPGWAARELQGSSAVQGNLDPLMLVAGGRALEIEAGRILDALGHGPFIFNLGHGVVPETPPEHVAELAAIVRGWRP
jgi:uroporphyrinogen decarboxylase